MEVSRSQVCTCAPLSATLRHILRYRWLSLGQRRSYRLCNLHVGHISTMIIMHCHFSTLFKVCCYKFYKDVSGYSCKMYYLVKFFPVEKQAIKNNMFFFFLSSPLFGSIVNPTSWSVFFCSVVLKNFPLLNLEFWHILALF